MLVVSCSHAAAASPHPIPDAVFEFIKPFAKKEMVANGSLQSHFCAVYSPVLPSKDQYLNMVFISYRK